VTEISGAWGAGLATLAGDGRVLDTWYPSPTLVDRPPELPCGGDGPVPQLAEPGTLRVDDAAGAARLLGADPAGALGPDDRRGVERVAVVTYVERLDDPPVDAHDV
jgi:2,3,4,5-tetrahydropyridine-2,6-dicarboxylate N-succinyltransferase